MGPHVLMSKGGLQRTGLVTVGSLIEYAYRIAMPPAASIQRFNDDAKAAFPDSGWEIRDRNNAAPGIKRFVEQVTMFLTLVGLTALAVGGVGAGQAVSAFLDRKREEIATLKSLGAEGGLIFLVYFLQVMMIAVAAVIVGLIVGAALPFLVEEFFAADIPVAARYGIYPEPLLLAALFGLLSAAAFAIPPLARAREIMPASLFRDVVHPRPRAWTPALSCRRRGRRSLHRGLGTRAGAFACLRGMVSGRCCGNARRAAADGFHPAVAPAPRAASQKPGTSARACQSHASRCCDGVGDRRVGFGFDVCSRR